MKRIILLLLMGTTLPFVAVGADDKVQFQKDFLRGNLSWQQVEQHATKEGKVNFYYWGGSDTINNWVDTVAIPAMKKKGIKLNPVRNTNPKDSIDLILAEKSSGRTLGEGSVDVTWLNGGKFCQSKTQYCIIWAFCPLVAKC